MNATTNWFSKGEDAGIKYRDLYFEEFGEMPEVETQGDWDATALAEAWREATRDEERGTSADGYDDFVAGFVVRFLPNAI